MMNAVKEPKKSRKTIIYEEAARLFKEKGYQASSMRDLAQRVNLEPSSLYSHIKSKDELLRKICFDCADRFINGMVEIKTQPISPVEKIERLINLHIDVALDEPMSATVFNDEWRNLSENYLQQFKSLRKQYESDFIKIIDQGIEQNELHVNEPEIILNTLLSSFRWIQPLNPKTDKWNNDMIKKTVRAFILKGITKTR